MRELLRRPAARARRRPAELRVAGVLSGWLLLSGCSTSGPAVTTNPHLTSAPAPSAVLPALSASALPTRDASAPPPSSAAPAASAGIAGSRAAPAFSAAEAEEILFVSPPAGAAACREAGRTDPERIGCLIDLRFAPDPAAAQIARQLYAETGGIAGVEREHIMDGGWRGQLRLVPEPPLGRHRRHLLWIRDAALDLHSFFEQLGQRAPAGRQLSYRYQPLALRFFRSVGRTTPSAYAGGWEVAYNVMGSLHVSADAVRETYFHEIFHLNDQAHGSWSTRALTPIFQRIMDQCTPLGAQRPSTACLRPFAPNHTMVRGGTYYAFTPGNGVQEYAAEIAVRYYREHRRILLGKGPQLGRPFKCGPAANRESWQLLADELFAGVDLVPECH